MVRMDENDRENMFDANGKLSPEWSGIQLTKPKRSGKNSSDEEFYMPLKGGLKCIRELNRHRHCIICRMHHDELVCHTDRRTHAVTSDGRVYHWKRDGTKIWVT